MLDEYQKRILLQAISSGSCILYTGAGFSRPATNLLNVELPSSSDLADQLWSFSGLDQAAPRTNQDLQKVFDHAVRDRGSAATLAFLKERLQVRDVPADFRFLSEVYWYRIYSTNVDNLVELIYKQGAGPKLEVINALHGRLRDRDQFLQRLQYVKLNGSLDESVDSLTFGAQQYRRRLGSRDPWWDTFVSDYSTHVTVFIGSSLNEPLLEEALESRGGRGAAPIEGRKRGFLITDRIDPLLKARLEDLRIDWIDANSADFLRYLNEATAPRPRQFEVLASGAPHLAQYGRLVSGNPRLAGPAEEFLGVFQPVVAEDAPVNYSSLFHFGAAATWRDLAASLDAHRDVVSRIEALLDEIFAGKTAGAIVLRGHRGAGKTTALMRLAVNAASHGVPTYFVDAENAQLTADAAAFVEASEHRLLLVVDNMDRAGARGFEFVERVRKAKTPPILLASVRASAVEVADDMEATEVEFEIMSESEMRSLMTVMRSTHSLGVLQDSSDAQVLKAFAQVARKQLLVAMKEATSGRHFDEIIRNEFAEITDERLRLAYVVICLATDVGMAMPLELLTQATPLNAAVTATVS